MRNGGRSLEKNPGISNLSIWLNSDQYMKKKKKKEVEEQVWGGGKIMNLILIMLGLDSSQ